MSESGLLTINTDGGARGNPGPAAFAYVIQRDGAPPIEEAGLIGRGTNNQAEYAGLIAALEHAERLGASHRLQIHCDSELLVKQMNGEYRVKDEGLKPLYEKARRIASRFRSVTIQHIPRAQNAWADRLYNAVLDAATTPEPRRSRAQRTNAPGQKAPSGVDRDSAAHEEAIDCLRAAAKAWARGNANEPAPELVWEQIWSVLEEQGVVRVRKR
jgi:ribonuclease HI